MLVMFKRMGLTGNIGSGKSAVANLLRGHSIAVIDLDEIGREVASEPSVSKQIIKIFGTSDRKLIRADVFSSPEKRKALENILHPIIWKDFESRAEKLRQAGHRLVICEAALLYEAGLDKSLDAIVVVSANKKTRRDRLLVRENMSADHFDRIEKAQMAEAEKLKKATYILDNSDGVEALRPQVLSLVNRWKAEGYID